MQVYQWALSSNAPFTFLQTFSAWRLIFFFKKYISFVLSQYKNKAHCTYCSIGKFFCLFLNDYCCCSSGCGTVSCHVPWLSTLYIYIGFCILDCVRPIWAVVFLWSPRVLGFLPQNDGLYKLVSGDSSNNHWEGNSNPIFEMMQCWLDFQTNWSHKTSRWYQ